MVIVGASHKEMFSMNLLFGRKKWRVRSLEASKKLQNVRFCAKIIFFRYRGCGYKEY